MKKYIFILSLIFCLSAGVAVSEEDTGTETQQSETVTDGAKEEKDCKKVCVKRDGYGMCTEFEERCEE